MRQLLVLIIILMPLALRAQTGILYSDKKTSPRAICIDSVTGKPTWFGVSIMFNRLDKPSKRHYYSPDTKGRMNGIRFLEPGDWEMCFYGPSYCPKRIVFHLDSTTDTELDTIYLQPLPIVKHIDLTIENNDPLTCELRGHVTDIRNGAPIPYYYVILERKEERQHLSVGDFSIVSGDNTDRHRKDIASARCDEYGRFVLPYPTCNKDCRYAIRVEGPDWIQAATTTMDLSDSIVPTTISLCLQKYSHFSDEPLYGEPHFFPYFNIDDYFFNLSPYLSTQHIKFRP